jgi:hypothetical protein
MVVACHAYKRSNCAQKIYRQIKSYKGKLEELLEQEELTNEPQTVWIGKFMKGN